jgi:hypothetical protein
MNNVTYNDKNGFRGFSDLHEYLYLKTDGKIRMKTSDRWHRLLSKKASKATAIRQHGFVWNKNGFIITPGKPAKDFSREEVEKKMEEQKHLQYLTLVEFYLVGLEPILAPKLYATEQDKLEFTKTFNVSVWTRVQKRNIGICADYYMDLVSDLLVQEGQGLITLNCLRNSLRLLQYFLILILSPEAYDLLFCTVTSFLKKIPRCNECVSLYQNSLMNFPKIKPTIILELTRRLRYVLSEVSFVCCAAEMDFVEGLIQMNGSESFDALGPLCASYNNYKEIQHFCKSFNKGKLVHFNERIHSIQHKYYNNTL